MDAVTFYDEQIQRLRDRIVELQQELSRTEELIQAAEKLRNSIYIRVDKRRGPIFQKGKIERDLIDVIRAVGRPINAREVAGDLVASFERYGHLELPVAERACSSRLSKLAKSGKLKSERIGRYVCYSIPSENDDDIECAKDENGFLSEEGLFETDIDGDE